MLIFFMKWHKIVSGSQPVSVLLARFCFSSWFLSFSIETSLFALSCHQAEMDLSASGVILGIDLGTTSLKVCIVETETKEALFAKSEKTLADIRTPTPQSTTKTMDELQVSEVVGMLSEQNVHKIWETLLRLLDGVDEGLMHRIEGIGVTGQQHGIVLWNSKAFLGKSINEEFGSVVVSSLITWQDQRCSSTFLRTIPQPQEKQVLATGYGCCSLFWLLKNNPMSVEGYDMSGTIMDFFVWVLCMREKPIMSPQNAESWGYFSRMDNTWDLETLRNAGFPVGLLPLNQSPHQFFAGPLRCDWKGMRRGVPVSVAMGDLQCSFVASLENKDDAIMNLSTSSQLTFIRPAVGLTVPFSCDVRSYFEQQELITAPSLNGGNILELLSRKVRQMIQQCTGEDCAEERLWKIFAEQANSEDWTKADDPFVIARLFGERYSMDSQACIGNLSPGNFDLGPLVRGILKGIITNLEAMLPKNLVHASGIKRVMLTGSLFTTFPQLKDLVTKVYGLPVAERSGGKDAAYGAAYVTAMNLRTAVEREGMIHM